MKTATNSKEAKWELLFVSILFIFLWAYLFVRANTVFYIHDEIATKWAYMVSWNPFPFQGFVDANNHFINSLFGGLFIRLFQSDSIWIVRLPNLLAFPLFFWSIFGLRNFFKNKINFYWLLATLTCSAFIIEYFGLARGYGISMALLVFALQQTLMCFKNGKIKHFMAALFAWVFAIYANLTLIPFALAGLVYLAIFLWKEHRKKWIAAVILAMFPLGYAIKYSFHLKQIGKLYYGEQDGIIDTTIHSLTPYLWNIENTFVDIVLVVLALFILFTVIWNLFRTKNLFENNMVFSLFFVLGVGNIFAQNLCLGINFPEDRAALYLVIFFFGALCFTIDYWNNKWIAYPFIILTLVLFGFNMNLKKSIFYYFEHFDIELITKIPDQVNGIPPSTGGRFWRMDNELIREKNLPLRTFQIANNPSDTLEDYIVSTAKIRPDLLNLYHPVYKDKISGLTLFERNQFLPRKKINEVLLKINGVNEYYNLYVNTLDKPLFLRCSGVLEDMNIFKEAILVFSAEDSINRQHIYYQGIPITESCAIQESGEIFFDFTFAMNYYVEANQLKVYLWNKEKNKLKGEISLEVYIIPDFLFTL